MNRYIVMGCTQVDNCQATVVDGRPYILYNPQFLQSVRRLDFSSKQLPTVQAQDWETLTILAHELGHHINNHLTNPLPGATGADMELEADRSAGFMIYLMGGSLAQASSAYAQVSEKGGYTHPGRAPRLEALRKGYEDAASRYPRKVEPNPVAPPVTPSVTGPVYPLASGWEHAEAFARDMVWVDGGMYRMGCPDPASPACKWMAVPVHDVKVSGFWIARYEVTQRQWEWVMGNRPSQAGDCLDCPVENVSWEEAQAFVRKLNGLTGGTFRLPSEAEWEFAARGGNLAKGLRYSGDDAPEPVAWYVGNSSKWPNRVGKKKPNELGLHDMTGNVEEWCEDWFEPYGKSAEIDPKGPAKGAYRVHRGGSFILKDINLPVWSRGMEKPLERSPYIGLRLAASRQ
jgi:hypothetical protein